LILPWTASYALNLLITLFWIVGITNAVNMLDNMDGLAAGVSAIAAVFLALNFYINEQLPQALMLIAFAGALLGFLVYNHHPASIFMGDCGSMFVGFFLACSALAAGPGGGRSRSIVAVLAVPVLVLVVPIFDTTLVTLMRKLAGRPASQGGRDHTSHRLVALGLSEKHAVWMLYTFAISGGAVAMLVRHVALDVSVGAIVAFSVVLTLLGVQLARVRVYDESEVTPPPGVFGFLLNLSYKRRLFEVALDVVLIVLSYYFANALVFGPAAVSGNWDLFLRTLSLALALKLAALLLSGVYRGLWRYATLRDVAVYARGVLLGSAATVVYAGLVEGFRRLTLAVFVIDAMLLLLAITASRLGFSALRKLVPLHPPNGSRVVIYGAGDGGELLFRQLLHNRELGRVPVAFLDDDVRKEGRVLHGLTIATPNGPGSVAPLCRAFAAEELLLSTEKLPAARLREVIDECERAGIVVRRMTIDLRPLTRESLARA
jgi:UDP-GlcNAc:undecaprenyl-phosphate GlcNAc-1-phosphate transferase